MGKKIDLTGQRFGRLTVISQDRSPHSGNEAWWVCVCDCGGEKVTRGYSLRIGDTTSCGCYHRERASAASTVHGASRGDGGRDTPEYVAWMSMNQRCNGTHKRACRNYSDRGITVCDRWRHDFAAFFADMGPRPSPRHSIDRINNDGNYEPGNCRWATWVEQAQNRRSTKNITLDGVAKCLVEWERESGVNYTLIKWRIKRGWDLRRAIYQPPRKMGKAG